jgi:hypothetical protein
MKRSYFDLPKRLPAAGGVLRPRVRSVSLAVAVALVAVLWLTIGLPILAVVARADARNGGAREVVLAAVVRKARHSARTEAAAELTTIRWSARLPTRTGEAHVPEKQS